MVPSIVSLSAGWLHRLLFQQRSFLGQQGLGGRHVGCRNLAAGVDPKKGPSQWDLNGI